MVPAMGRKKDPTVRTLVFAFASVVISFFFSTLLSEYRTRGIRHAAIEIFSDSAPGMMEIEEIRSEVRHFQVLVDDFADGDNMTPEHREGIAKTKERLLDAAKEYFSQPASSTEKKLWPMTHETLDQLIKVTEKIFKAREQKNGFDARRLNNLDFKPLCERLDSFLVLLVRVNMDEIRTRAVKIEKIWKQSFFLSVALDILSILFAIVAAFTIFKVVRRYTELLERQAEELGLFASRMAHDILNPTAAAAMAFDVVATEAPQDKELAEIMHQGRGQLRMIDQIVRGLLAFARSGAIPRDGETSDLDAVLQEVIQESARLAERHQVSVRLDAQSGLQVKCNRGLLLSILSNLVHNAIYYMGETRTRNVVIRAMEENSSTIVFEVEDSGPGLPNLPDGAIFEPYVRGPANPRSGLGLGLATVRRIIEAHGGAIEAQSKQGHGTIFRFSLPGAQETMSAKSSRSFG